MKTLIARAMCSAALLSLALPATAQTIDYGALEQLFGEPVTTSATGKPQRASDAPVGMEIVSADDIRKSGAASLPDILQRVVGLDVWRWSAQAADIAVRGYNSPASPRLLVLVNGRQVYMDQFGMTEWSTIPVELAEIRQIEVVKGPNTALFGFNAVGGVVNIITYSPLYDDVNNVTVRAGTQHHGEFSGVTTIKMGDKAGLRLSAGGYNAHDFDTPVPASERGTLMTPMRRSFSADALIQLTDNSQLGAELTKAHTRQNDMIPGFSLRGTDMDTWSAKVSYSANTKLGLIEAVAYHNALDQDAGPTTNVNSNVTVARLQDLFKIGTDHSFRLAAEWRRNQMDTIYDRGGRVSYDVYSVGGMWDWTISDKLSLVNAVRLDHLQLKRSGSFTGPSPYTNSDYDQTLTQPSLNSSLVYKPSAVDTLRFSIARGVQTPSLVEYGYINAASGSVASYGNPRMNPSLVTNYEIGYDRTISAINGLFRASVYYQTNDDMKFGTRILRIGRPTVTYFDNVGDSKIVGTEASLKGKLDENWSWKAGYAFEKINDDLTATSLDFQHSTPRHKVSAEINYTNGPWEANLFALYVSEVEMLRSGVTGFVKVPNYLSLSGRIGYNVTKDVQVALSGMNVGHSEQRLTSGRAEERRLFLTLSSKF